MMGTDDELKQEIRAGRGTHRRAGVGTAALGRVERTDQGRCRRLQELRRPGGRGHHRRRLPEKFIGDYPWVASGHRRSRMAHQGETLHPQGRIRGGGPPPDPVSPELVQSSGRSDAERDGLPPRWKRFLKSGVSAPISRRSAAWSGPWTGSISRSERAGSLASSGNRAAGRRFSPSPS